MYRTWLVRIAALSAVTWLSLATAAVRHAAGLKPPGKADTESVTPLSYFGMHIHRADGDSPWPEGAIGSWRLHDAYVSWLNLQPLRSHWSWLKLDGYVKLSNSHGVDLLLPLAYPPRWAAARPDDPSGYGPGHASEPASIEDWRTYVETVANRYRGRIRAYEMWNEVNISHSYSGDVETLVRMTCEAYRILKRVDRDNILVSPSIVGIGKHLNWLSAFLAGGGGRCVDVIGHHFYVPRTSPEAMLSDIQAVRAVLARHHVSQLPTWNTETGWRIANTDGTPEIGSAGGDWIKLNPEEAANYVARALILGRHAGLGRFYWYAWDNTDLGLIEPTALSVKPAGIAYQTTLRWLSGQKFLGCTSGPNSVWTCLLENTKGEHARILWSTRGRLNHLPARRWRTTAIEDLTGRTYVHSSSGPLSLTGSPVLLKSEHRTWPGQTDTR